MITRHAFQWKGRPGSVAQCETSDLSDVLRWAETTASVPRRNVKIIASRPNRLDWYGLGAGRGGLTGEEATAEAWRIYGDLRRHGWAEGAQRVYDLARKLEAILPPAIDIRRRPVWSSDGDSIDIDRALKGDWDRAFRTTSRRPLRGLQVVSLGIEWGASAWVHPDVLQWSGVALAAASAVLENAGYRTELIAATCTRHPDNTYAMIRVTAKRPEDLLDVEQIAATVVHPASFRLGGIGALGLNDSRIDYGFGQSQDVLPVAAQLEAEGILPATDVWMQRPSNEKDAFDIAAQAIAKLQEEHTP